MRFSVTLVLFVIFATSLQAESSISIVEPWVREAPPNAPASGAFMQLQNSGGSDRNLVAASCDSRYFGKIELHRTIMEDGMAKMIEQPQITIPASGSVVFKPGDYHLMLMRPAQRLRAGESLSITLKFANGETVTQNFLVKRMAAMPMQHHNMSMQPHSMHSHPMQHQE